MISLLELCYVGAALFLASQLWFFFRVLRPLRHLSLQAELLSQGDLNSFERQCGGIPEIQNLRRAMVGMVGHVRRAQEQHRVYTEQLTDSQETERKRIARELHDDTVQSVIAITQGIDMAKTWMRSDPDRTEHMLRTVREQAVEVVTSLRNLIGGLRPPALEELGLVPALEMQLNTLHDITPHLKITGDPRRLDEQQELALFRSAQEALQNVARHSGAAHVYIDVSYQPEGVLLTIRDNGNGFQPPVDLHDLALEAHYGLLGIQERMKNLGGWFRVDSQPGHGVFLQAYISTQARLQPDKLVQDPVCSALIEPKQAYGSLSHDGDTYYFCCPVCQGAFQKDPSLYLGEPSTRF